MKCPKCGSEDNVVKEALSSWGHCWCNECGWHWSFPQQQRIRALEEGLRKLMLESKGFVSMADPTQHGNTNIAVMNHWIENAEKLLKGE